MRSKITYDSNLMKVIALFESITQTQLKDCFVINDVFHFVLNPEDMGKAIGKSGSNIKRIEFLLKKKVKVVEFSNDLAKFIKNLIYPMTADSVDVDGKSVTIRSRDSKTKGLLIGRDSRNLSSYREIISRYFDIGELKVA